MSLLFGKRVHGFTEVATVARAYVKVRLEHDFSLRNGHEGPGSRQVRLVSQQ